MKNRTRRSGFSTIELVVVLAIAAIIAAIALPGWKSWSHNAALNSSIRQIQSELHAIKMRAAAENVGFQFAYLQDANEYTVQRDSKPLQTKPITQGTTITKSGTISFSPRGTAGSNRVRLRNAAGACRQIVVSATGRVRICTPGSCTEDC
jgi:prepilin-type N-terminal cleavage/methylation domain-containing protein